MFIQSELQKNRANAFLVQYSGSVQYSERFTIKKQRSNSMFLDKPQVFEM